MVQLFPWQQRNGKWWGLFVYFLSHRAQGPCGCPIIISLSTGDEKSKHKSCIQNSCMLLSRIFFFLVLDKFHFPLSWKVFLSYLTLSLWQCWICTKFKEEKMHIQHYQFAIFLFRQQIRNYSGYPDKSYILTNAISILQVKFVNLSMLLLSHHCCWVDVVLSLTF